MAVCEACGREMLTAIGCSFKYIELMNGKRYKREKVGDEGWCSKGDRCPDCGARFRHFHHPGCDVERCPVCGEQLLSCSCDIKYFVNETGL